jgi:hypothetical protein
MNQLEGEIMCDIATELEITMTVVRFLNISLYENYTKSSEIIGWVSCTCKCENV